MPKDSPIPLPKSSEGLIAWVLANPQAVRQAIEALNLLLSVQVQLTVPNTTRTDQQGIVMSRERYLMPIAIKFPNNWAVATGTASRATFVTSTVTTEELAQRFMALEQDLIRVGIMAASA